MSNKTFGLGHLPEMYEYLSNHLFLTDVLLHHHLTYLKIEALSETNLVLEQVLLLVLLIVVEVLHVVLRETTHCPGGTIGCPTGTTLVLHHLADLRSHWLQFYLTLKLWSTISHSGIIRGRTKFQLDLTSG